MKPIILNRRNANDTPEKNTPEKNTPEKNAPEKDAPEGKSRALYLQVYDQLKSQILRGEMSAGEKLPSLRILSGNLGVSITTAELAYNQLLVEGYITSRPQSGYYVARVTSVKGEKTRSRAPIIYDLSDYTLEGSPYLYDLSCFDFSKWKKCAARVFSEYSHLLLFESDPQGERALRFEIAKYIFTSRGVTASPGQIVIGAGTQQITSHLSRILRRMGIHHVSLESPGYLPVQRQFSDGGFTISHIPVGSDGIQIDRLPVNIPSAVYVSPSNQFPTGAVMPVGRRYDLLKWARANHSIIIEDDYDSELRYFGKPVPALQGLDESGRVVYLGSFSSTLFPAVKISYMVLPEGLSQIFDKIKDQYTQTCSKAEQLTLAFFMEYGYYASGIRKLRNLYAQKLQTALAAFTRFGAGFVTPVDTRSGINLSIRIRSAKSAETLSEEARSLQLHVVPLSQMSETEAPAAGDGQEAVAGGSTGDAGGRPNAKDASVRSMIFYYNQVPLGDLEERIRDLLKVWRE